MAPAISGENDGFEELYTQNADLVYRFLLRLTHDAHLAEEYTQECFFRAYKTINKFEGRCKLSVWLCQIAKNCYLDDMRKKSRPVAREAAPAAFEEELQDRDAAGEIVKIVFRLEEPYKEVFMLRVYAEQPYKNIAELFGKNESWARVIFFRAKERVLVALTGK